MYTVCIHADGIFVWIGGVCTLRGVSSSCASREIGKSVVSEKPVEIGVKRKINEDC